MNLEACSHIYQSTWEARSVRTQLAYANDSKRCEAQHDEENAEKQRAQVQDSLHPHLENTHCAGHLRHLQTSPCMSCVVVLRTKKDGTGNHSGVGDLLPAGMPATATRNSRFQPSWLSTRYQPPRPVSAAGRWRSGSCGEDPNWLLSNLLPVASRLQGTPAHTESAALASMRRRLAT